MSPSSLRKFRDGPPRRETQLRFLFHFYDLRQRAGIQRAICELSNALVKDGHEVFIISATEAGEVTYDLDSRVSLIEVAHPEPRRFGPSAWPFRAAWAFRQLRYVSRITKKLKPSIFVDHGTSLGLLYPFRTLAGVPFVVQRHFSIGGFPNGRVMHRLLYYLKRSALIAVLTEGAATDLRSYGYRNAYVIPNVVPAGACPAEYPNGFPRVGLLMGRASPQKGFDIFLEALALQKIPGWHFTIVGPGVDEDPQLRSLVERYRLHNEVSLLPATNSPYDFITKASCVIMPSRYEGLPFVALESLAIGRPVIAADVDGLRDVVIDGVNGRLFPSGDIQKLSERLVLTCDDERALSTFARNAPSSIEQFRAKRVIGAWEKLIAGEPNIGSEASQ